MHQNFLKILPLLTCTLFAGCCEKENIDPCMFDRSQCPVPDLCAESDNCDDGILEELLRSWEPNGGNFDGQIVIGGCINGICPDIHFTFFNDSTYLINTTKVFPDSSGLEPVVVQGQETGTYRVGDCKCRQDGNWWDGYRTSKDGKIYFSPAGGNGYQVNFQHFAGGMFLTNSTRDSTFQLFVH